MKLILLITGGAIGTLMRYAISTWLNIPGDDKFPWGTFSVNVAGSAVIGLLAGIFSGGDLSSNLKIFLFTGLLGGFTTFSTYSLECLNLIKNKETLLALIYIVATNTIGIGLAILSFLFGRSYSTPQY